MCRKKADIKYLPIKKREDMQFFRHYAKKYKIVGWENPPYYYVRLIHGYNTWNDSHFGIKNRSPNTFSIEEKSQDYLFEVIGKYEFCLR